MMKIMQIIIILFWMIMVFLPIIIMINHSHPILMMIMLIMMNMIMCFYMSLWKSNYMFSILMFLIMISGLFIIFMYFASLISNDKMVFNPKKSYLMLFFLNNFILNYTLYNNKLIMMNMFSYSFLETNALNHLFINNFYNIVNMYMYPLNNMTLLSIFLILFMFISIIKLNSSSHSLSMRKINYDKII